MPKCCSLPKGPLKWRDGNLCIKVSPCSKSIINSDPANVESVALSAIDEHDRQVQGGSGNVRKNAPESSVSIISIKDCPALCVKHFRYRGAGHAAKGLFRPTHGLRAFRSGTYLFEHGFTAAAPLSLVRKSRFKVTVEEWLVMSVVPDSKELDRYLVACTTSQWSAQEKRNFLDVFADFLAGLHESGVFHTDLKTCNVLVYDRPHKPVKFSLLDYDDVRVFRSGVSLKRRAKNLAQLFLSTPSDIDMDDRMKFLDRYLLACSKTNIEKRRLLKMVCNRIDGKSLLYVGPEGDISENWPAANELDRCYESFVGP